MGKKFLLRFVVFGSVLMVMGTEMRAFADDAPRISFPPMSQDEIDRFRDGLKNNVPLVSIPPKISQKVEPNVEGVWAGSNTEVSTSIGEVVLRFRPLTEELLARSVTAENASNALLEYVDLKVAFGDQEIIFVHSHPQDGREVGGFKAKVKRKDNPTRVKMIFGQRDSGMYVAVPPLDDPTQLWGIYVCPRMIQHQSVGRTGTRVMKLENSPYQLTEVKVTADAVGSATLEASRGKVRAAVILQLSDGLPESISPRDVSISAVAEPKVRYRPKVPFDFSRFAPRTDAQQGVNVLVEFQNRAGKIRRQNFSHVASVHKSQEPSPVAVQVHGERPTADAGECYIVQVQKYGWKEYDSGEVAF